MKSRFLTLSVVLLLAPFALSAQSSSSSAMLAAAPAAGAAQAPYTAASSRTEFAAPFSRMALGAGVSPLGINLMAATNINRYMTLRATGSIFKYTINNISTNGFNVGANLNLASAGASLDFFPFPRHGLRFSPGVLFYNTNGASATFTAQGGTSFTLNNITYYSSSSNPVKGLGTFGLHSQNPAFTITGGWGNVIPHNGGHFSFPVEVGIALIGAPSLNIALTSGQVCDAQGQNCVNVATDATVQSDLQAQIAKYKHDMDPLKTYPIVSFGVAYAFRIR